MRTTNGKHSLIDTAGTTVASDADVFLVC